MILPVKVWLLIVIHALLETSADSGRRTEVKSAQQDIIVREVPVGNHAFKGAIVMKLAYQNQNYALLEHTIPRMALLSSRIVYPVLLERGVIQLGKLAPVVKHALQEVIVPRRIL
jgi:hypothetical protein